MHLTFVNSISGSSVGRGSIYGLMKAYELDLRFESSLTEVGREENARELESEEEKGFSQESSAVVTRARGV
jgi:hypothetical protein